MSGDAHVRFREGLGVRFPRATRLVILMRPGRGQAGLSELRRICARLSLSLSEEKTRVVDAMRESFQFLGFEVRKVRWSKSGKWGPRVLPAKKSEQQVRDRLREIANRRTGWRPVEDAVSEMNRVLRGWGNYYHYGHPQRAMKRINHFAEERLRKWLMRRRQQSGPGYKHYPTQAIYGEIGLHRLPTARPG